MTTTFRRDTGAFAWTPAILSGDLQIEMPVSGHSTAIGHSLTASYHATAIAGPALKNSMQIAVETGRRRMNR